MAKRRNMGRKLLKQLQSEKAARDAHRIQLVKEKLTTIEIKALEPPTTSQFPLNQARSACYSLGTIGLPTSEVIPILEGRIQELETSLDFAKRRLTSYRGSLP